MFILICDLCCTDDAVCMRTDDELRTIFCCRFCQPTDQYQDGIPLALAS